MTGKRSLRFKFNRCNTYKAFHNMLKLWVILAIQYFLSYCCHIAAHVMQRLHSGGGGTKVNTCMSIKVIKYQIIPEYLCLTAPTVLCASCSYSLMSELLLQSYVRVSPTVLCLSCSYSPMSEFKIVNSFHTWVSSIRGN